MQYFDDKPAFIVAEIGINHNGKVETAADLIDAAAKCGVDAVKFQNIHARNYITPDITHSYWTQGAYVTEGQLEMFLRYELFEDQLRQLQGYAESKGLVWFATPTDSDSLQELVGLEVPLLKVASCFVTHIPLIEQMARSGIPIVLSTGMADFREIAMAKEAAVAQGATDITICQCTSDYPTRHQDTNLGRMLKLREVFGVPVGFSDHTKGTVAAMLAAGMGAVYIEKHFTLHHEMHGPDHRFSADPSEMKALVEAVRCAEPFYGDPDFDPKQGRDVLKNRVSCYAARDLPSDHEVAPRDILYCRPGTGLSPRWAKKIIGQRLIKRIGSMELFTEKHVRLE